MSSLNESFYEIALKEYYARKEFKAKMSELNESDQVRIAFFFIVQRSICINLKIKNFRLKWLN